MIGVVLIEFGDEYVFVFVFVEISGVYIGNLRDFFN